MDQNSSQKSLPVFSLSTARSYMNKLPNDLCSKVHPHFSCVKVIVTFFRTSERRSRCKRNKGKGPAGSAGSTPFMPDCFLTAAERSDPRNTTPCNPEVP